LALEEPGGVGAVEHAVVVGQAQVGHPPDGDGVAVGVGDHHGAFIDRAGGQDPDLGRVRPPGLAGRLRCRLGSLVGLVAAVLVGRGVLSLPPVLVPRHSTLGHPRRG
jgi:hypothetical protein